MSFSHATPQLIGLPLVYSESGVRHSLAGSPVTPAESSLFVILRTGHSPPVALHLVFQRRDYSWLQAGERIPGEDLHPSGHRTLSGAQERPFRAVLRLLSPRALAPVAFVDTVFLKML